MCDLSDTTQHATSERCHTPLLRWLSPILSLSTVNIILSCELPVSHLLFLSYSTRDREKYIIVWGTFYNLIKSYFSAVQKHTLLSGYRRGKCTLQQALHRRDSGKRSSGSVVMSMSFGCMMPLMLHDFNIRQMSNFGIFI